MPKFSVIIPCYNAEHTIAATIASLQAQTCGDWEAICIDDGSTDTSRAILTKLAATDPRITVCDNPGKGPSDARNTGALSISCGAIIAFCDADDQWLPEKLAQLDAAFSDPTVDGVFGKVGFFNATPDDCRTCSTIPTAPLSVDLLLGENPVCTMSNLALRRASFTRSGGLDRTMVHNEDLEWLVRLLGKNTKIIGLNELQVWYRTTTTGLSADIDAMRRGRDQVVSTARQLGYAPSPRSEAIYSRYLARRALRVGAPRFSAFRLTLHGLRHSPTAFLLPLQRGGLTALASFLSPLLPRRLSHALFTK